MGGFLPGQTWVSDDLFGPDLLPQWNPGVVAAIVVMGLLVLIAGAAFWAYLRRPAGRRFAGMLAKRDAVAVVMHPNPDPDAMACALGVAAIADRHGTSTTLYYPGEIRHQENRAFRTVLDVEADSLTDASDLSGDVVLVDHNEPRGFEGDDEVVPIAVVDHHPGGGSASGFTDVRTDYGACATIIAEYLEDLGVRPVDPDENDVELHDENGVGPHELPSRVATGLMYGIHSDTNHLTNGCHSAEFQASSYLYPGVDAEALDRIANPEVDAEVLDVKGRAIQDRTVDGPFAIADVGNVSNTDAIPQAADELIRLEGVTAVVVYGDSDGVLSLSGRSRDDRVHMGDTLGAVFEGIPGASAGGHARMGGGTVSIDRLDEVEGGWNGQEEDGTDGPRERLEQRLFDAMSGEIQ